MTNTLEEHLEGLVTRYQDINRRNAPRIGKAAGRLCGLLIDIEKNSDISDFDKKIYLRDLKYIYENIDEIEL